MRIHQSSWRRVLLVSVAILVTGVLASSSLGAPGRGGPRAETRKPAGKDEAGPEHRKTLLEAWKQARARTAARSPFGVAPAPAAAVARPSMVINGAGTVLYTKQIAGNACDPDPGSPEQWRPTTGYAANDEVRPFLVSSLFFFRATNSGTSGATEPAWPNTFGATVLDGTITWQAVDQFWTANRTYALGTVVRATGSYFGFNFRVTQAGTTGATEPRWPTTPGATVTDGTVIWQAIAFHPGDFAGCVPMQLVVRASGGAETVLASEGDPIGGAGSQLGGWSEFYALNSSGQVAFRPVIEGRLTDEDESGTGVLVAGPGAGALTEIAASNTAIVGRGVCGFGPMVAINDVSQVLYDGYTTTLALWQPNHAYPLNSRVIATTGIGLNFIATVGGTSGALEPTWPTTINTNVTDGGVTWRSQISNGSCGEDNHGMYRFTPGTGNELLIAVGTNVGGGVTVVGFGNEVVPATGGCPACRYQEIDGFLTPGGHASVAVRLSNGDTAAYLLTGQLAFTQVARTGGAGPGGVFGRIYSRTELNASDQVLFKAQVGGVDKLIRWTAPSTFNVVASVGDDIGTRSGGAASGTTITALGFYGDINATGNAVFQATLSSGPRAYFFWNAATGFITEIAREGVLLASFAEEMVTLNDLNVVAFTSGAGAQEGVEDAAELDEKGFHLWTAGGGVVN
nr:hypothetical protein [Acidobacteriota bacterium]